MWPTPIPNENLTLADVPGESAELNLINRFALTLDQKERIVFDIKSQSWDLITDNSSIGELRARLYLEQRRWNHFGRHPDPVTEAQIRRLISLIRAKLPR